jgi:LPS export ABC transporter protein LptC
MTIFLRNNSVYALLVIALILGVILLWETPNKLLTPFDELAPQNQFPYAVVEQAHTQHFDEQGKLSYEFDAKSLKHFRINLKHISAEDYTQLDAPEFTLQAEAAPWYATANNGTLTQKGELLTLWPNVRIWQTNKEGEIIELNTERLEIQPREKIIRTDALVQIISPQGRIQAKGIQVDLTEQRIQLLNQVEGYHEPILE